MNWKCSRSGAVSLAFLVATALVAPGTSSKADDAKNAADTKEAPALTAVNEKGKVTTFSVEAFGKLPRQTVKSKDHSGTPATYEGVALFEILRAADVAMGKELKGPLLANCLVVKALDGYRVVFSLPEVDPDVTDHVVLLADRKDGKPLDAKEGPYRLVVPQDKRYMRWVRQVTRIAVQGVAEIGPDHKERTKQ
jgi:hypothetical protein